MALLQDIVTAARALRADHKVDKKPLLTGVLYSKHPLHLDAIERLANVKLTVRNGCRAEAGRRGALVARVRPCARNAESGEQA